MIWYFIAHCTLLIGLFVWLDWRQRRALAWFDNRQVERYNLFAQWTQTFSPMLSEDIQPMREDLRRIRELLEDVQRIVKQEDQRRSAVEVENQTDDFHLKMLREIAAAKAKEPK